MSEVQCYVTLTKEGREDTRGSFVYEEYQHGEFWVWLKYDLNGNAEYHAVNNPNAVFFENELTILREKAVDFNDEPDS